MELTIQDKDLLSMSEEGANRYVELSVQADFRSRCKAEYDEELVRQQIAKLFHKQ